MTWSRAQLFLRRATHLYLMYKMCPLAGVVLYIFCLLNRVVFYQCDQCGKCFSEERHLWRHKRIYRREDPFECDQRQYKQTHSSEKQLKYEQPDDSYSICELLSDIKKIKQEDL